MLPVFIAFGFYNRWWRYVSTQDMWGVLRGVVVAVVAAFLVFAALDFHPAKVPRGIWVIDANGAHLGVIRMPEIAGNLNWGGRDWDELYCACSTSIYRVRMNVRGNQVAYMRMWP